MDLLSSTDSKVDYWQDMCQSEKMQKHFHDGLLADCKFVVGPEDESAEIIYGHKTLFIMESPVLEKMFCGDFIETAKDMTTVRIIDAYPKDFKNLCLMIYNNCECKLTILPVEDIITIYRLCDKYMISSIGKHCINHLKGSERLKLMSTADVITAFEFARDLEEETLKIVLIKTIQLNNKIDENRLNLLSKEAFSEYITIFCSKRSDIFSQSYNIEAAFSAINSYFVHNNLQIELNNIYDEEERKEKDPNDEPKCERTAEVSLAEINNNRKMLKILLQLFNFKNMNLSSFNEGPAKSKILNGEQKFYIQTMLLKSYLCVHNNHPLRCSNTQCKNYSVGDIKLY